MNKIFNGDNNFQIITLFSGLLILTIVIGIFITLFVNSYEVLHTFGLDFIIGTDWNPVTQEFNAFPFLLGTLLTSFIALFIAFPISLSIAIFLGELSKDGMLNTLINGAVELLAGIPSIIYGFWGLFVLTPLVRELQLLIDIPPYGVGIFTASIVLSIMIIPYAASLSREVISMSPNEIKEAGYALGATRFEVIKSIILPFSGSGIIAGVLLALGRALGETMAVTMVIGNSHIIPDNIFSPGNTMASLIANEFTEATEEIYLSSLIAIGLVLLIVTAIVNVTGKYIIKKFIPNMN